MELTYIGCVERTGVLGSGGAGGSWELWDSNTNMCIPPISLPHVIFNYGSW